jgi:peptidoglycan/xylan/chitin deacetylase (PgdA/CDA1 family)
MSRFGQFARVAGTYVPPGLVRAFGAPAAVFFHGVERMTDDARLQTNHHEVDDFVAMMRALKASFDVRPLSALDDVLKNPDANRKTMFLMSDDGYANTLGLAADILDDLKLPWTLFVSTEHIDTGAPNPVFLARLFAFYAPSGSYDLPHFPEPLELGDGREDVADAALGHLKTLDVADAREAIAAMASAMPDDSLQNLLTRFSSESFLDWDGVRALASRGVEIGAHAHWHWPMNSHQSDATLREQAQIPKARIEVEIGPCRYFAYPFGNIPDVGAAAWRAVREAGYEAAFTTLSGTLCGGMNRFLLPRYGLGPRDTALASLLPLLRAGNGRLRRFQSSLAS